MGSKPKKEDRVHYRHFWRLVSYLRHHRLRCVALIAVLIGEAWTAIFGLVLLKPILDLVFLGELVTIELEGTAPPLERTIEFFPDENTVVFRLSGSLAGDEDLIESALAWLGREEVETVVVDLRGLEEIPRSGWATLVGLGLRAQEGSRLLILSEAPPPPGVVPEILSGVVVMAAEAPSVATLADSVPLPRVEVSEAGALDRLKRSGLELVGPQIERLQRFAVQSNRNKYLILVGLVALIIVMTFLRCICGFFAGYLSGYLSEAVARRIKDELYGHMLHLEDGFYTRTNVGHLMTHVTQDVEVTRPAIETLFLGFLRGPINLLSVLLAMLLISWELTIYTLIMFPVLIFPTFWVAGRVRRYSRRTQLKRSLLNVILHETFTGVRIIRAYGTEAKEHDRFNRENWKLFVYRIRRAVVSSAAKQMTLFLSTIGMCVVLLLNGYYILEKGTITGSEFIVFLGLMVMVYRPLKKLTKANNKIIMAMAGAERIFPILDRESRIAEKPDAVELEPVQHGIRFEDVTFAYDTEPVLRGIDLDVPVGKVVAIVGASGSGKTTFINLLPRFWDPTGGRITVDGVDVRDVTLRSLRRQVAIVTQESILFDDTVGNNIAYGQDGVTEEQVIEAAKAANAHGFITAMPEGYETVIGDRGTRLSGGQRQRIAIARALIKGAPILVLDEATSALDTEAEREVQAAIDRLIKGHTAFIIAHRLSTIVNADEIIVLRDGRIVERGHHDALIAQNGEYARLYRMQFRETESVTP